jgi:hypothetical protein
VCIYIYIYIYMFFHGYIALVGLDLIVEVLESHSDTVHSVWLLQISDWLIANTSTWQHTTRKRDRPSFADGIRTHNPLSKSAAIDPHLRIHGHWDWQIMCMCRWNGLPELFKKLMQGSCLAPTAEIEDPLTPRYATAHRCPIPLVVAAFLKHEYKASCLQKT